MIKKTILILLLCISFLAFSLQADPISPFEYASEIKTLIHKHEATTKADAKAHGFDTGYDMPFHGGKFAMPKKPLSQMTISEVKAFQKRQIQATKGKLKGTSKGTGAVGKYQIVQGTLLAYQKKLGFTNNDTFSPELQERIANALLNYRGYAKYKAVK